MDHAVDVVFKADEQTEFGDVLDFTLDHAADRMGIGKGFPRVAQALLETQRDATFRGVDFQHHDVDFLRGRDDLAGVDVLLGPGHFRDVHQTFDTGFQLHEGAVIGDVGDAALVDRAQREFGFHRIPRVVQQLLHAQADAVGVLVDLDDLDLDGLADREDLRRVVDAAPGHVGDVQQAIDAAQINEGTVFGDVLHHAVDDLTFGQVADDFGALFGTRFFQDGTTRHNDVAATTVHLEDLERLLETHERAGIAHRTDVDLRARQEGHGAAQIDGEAALDATEDGAIDALFAGIGFFETVPGFFATGFLARDDGFATGVFDAIEVNFDLVANGDRGSFTGIREFFQINAAFHLVADVDDGLARLDGDDLALDDRPFLGGVDLEAFLQKGFEFFHASFGAHAVSFPLYGFSGHAVGSAGLSLRMPKGADLRLPPCGRGPYRRESPVGQGFSAPVPQSIRVTSSESGLRTFFMPASQSPSVAR